MHLSYLGDASVGRDSNIGAGTITCNYDGVRKNPTTIGERVFVGSGTELIAPIKIGDGAYIAACSSVTGEVATDSVAIARARQENKIGWVAARRAKAASPSSGQAATNPAVGSNSGAHKMKRHQKSRPAASPSKKNSKPSRRS